MIISAWYYVIAYLQHLLCEQKAASLRTQLKCFSLTGSGMYLILKHGNNKQDHSIKMHSPNKHKYKDYSHKFLKRQSIKRDQQEKDFTKSKNRQPDQPFVFNYKKECLQTEQ